MFSTSWTPCALHAALCPLTPSMSLTQPIKLTLCHVCLHSSHTTPHPSPSPITCHLSPLTPTHHISPLTPTSHPSSLTPTSRTSLPLLTPPLTPTSHTSPLTHTTSTSHTSPSLPPLTLPSHTDASDLYTWGIGHYGVLGHGESDKEALPRVVEALLGKDIVKFALGSKHMMAVSGECARSTTDLVSLCN